MTKGSFSRYKQVYPNTVYSTIFEDSSLAINLQICYDELASEDIPSSVIMYLVS